MALNLTVASTDLPLSLAEVKEELATRLKRELTEEGDPRMFGKGDEFDRYPYAAGDMRDYYNRYMSGEDISAGWINLTDHETEMP